MKYLQINSCENQNKEEVQSTWLLVTIVLSRVWQMGIKEGIQCVAKWIWDSITNTGDIKGFERIALLSAKFIARGFLLSIFVSLWGCLSQVWWVFDLIIQTGDTENLFIFISDIIEIISIYSQPFSFVLILVALRIYSFKYKKDGKFSLLKLISILRDALKTV